MPIGRMTPAGTRRQSVVSPANPTVKPVVESLKRLGPTSLKQVKR